MPRTINLKPASPWQEIRSTSADWDAMGEENLLHMLSHLHLVRAFEEMVLEFDAMGLIHGPAHVSIGQDGGAIASIAALRDSDQITGSHRGHHQFLAKALNHVDKDRINLLSADISDPVMLLLRRTLAEILGLSEGYCKGRGGSMHLRWEEAGALGTNAIVGGGVPIANGVAWAKKRQGGAVNNVFG